MVGRPRDHRFRGGRHLVHGDAEGIDAGSGEVPPLAREIAHAGSEATHSVRS
jgi:hypothetical protein